ncbi:pyridoxal phosphate-dependent transferase [Mycena galericulata]|nr:pyridoxal phosphate-dependent transferase [Mycena galericulata]
MSALTLKLSSALKAREQKKLSLRVPPVSTTTMNLVSADYLAFAQSDELRKLFLERLAAAPGSIFGAGASRLALNHPDLVELEARMARFFGAPDALVVNSGSNGNIAFFSSVPQPGDIVLHDEHVHASIYDGMRAGRARLVPFQHNSVEGMRKALMAIVKEEKGFLEGKRSVFLALETLYSMDATVPQLRLMSCVLEELLPLGNGYIVVDEAHATGIYGHEGRGIVSMFGMEEKCLMRLHTFGKTLTSAGAVMLTTPLIKQYMVNYGRSIIFTAPPTHSALISINCAFDLLESDLRTRMAMHLLDICTYFVHALRLALSDVPRELICLPLHLYRPISHDICTTPATTLPTPIIPLLTPRAVSLRDFLDSRGICTLAVGYPIVPKDKARLRLCVNADKTKEDVREFIRALLDWVQEQMIVGGKTVGGSGSKETVVLMGKL